MERMLNRVLNCGWDAAYTDPVLLRRVRTAAATAYLLILVGIPFLLRAYEWHISLRMLSVTSAIVLAAVGLLVMWIFRHFGMATQLVTLAVFVAGAGAIMTSGGIGTSTLGWWMLVPLLAGLLRGLGSGLGWGALVLVSIYACYWAEQHGFRFPDLTPPEHLASQQLLQALGITCAVLILVSNFLSQIGQSERQLAEHNKDLRQQVKRAEQAERDLTRALESKTRFLANMSHEMKTPLNAIVGFSRQLDKRAGGGLDERSREALQQVIKQSDGMLLLVNDLLALAQLDKGEAHNDELHALDLRDLLRRVVMELEPVAARYQLRIEMDAPESVTQSGNGDHLLQAVNSLLRHALASTRGAWVRVTLGELPQGALLQVLYPGMLAAHDRDRLFDRYNHLHSQLQRDVGLSGLAMALAYEHVTRHGGRIGVSVDEGMNQICFNLFLPS